MRFRSRSCRVPNTPLSMPVNAITLFPQAVPPASTIKPASFDEPLDAFGHKSLDRLSQLESLADLRRRHVPPPSGDPYNVLERRRIRTIGIGPGHRRQGSQLLNSFRVSPLRKAR